MDASPSGNTVLEANMRALRSRSTALAELVAAAEPYPLEPVVARSGDPTATVAGAWLHSRYDPRAEGDRIAAEAAASGASTLLFLGLGLGYAAKAAVDSGATVCAVESDASLLAASLRLVDLSALIASPRFSIALCPRGRGLTDYLNDASPRTIEVIENKAAMAAFPEAAEAMRSQVARYRKRDDMNAATIKRFGRLWVRNLAVNLRQAAASPGVSAIAGAFSGLPALVLAAGPSLDDLADSLPDLAERCVVVCVDTALRSALRYGVTPDFVVVVDPQYWNARHLDRCRADGAILVSEAAVWPSVLRGESWRPGGRTVLCSSIYPLGAYVESRLGQAKGRLGAGGSVSTTAWDFARTLGCSPIYMAGLDLSFPDGRTHARASLFEQRALASGDRLRPSSNAAFEAMRGGRPFTATANDGSAVVSDERLSLYASWFSCNAAMHPEARTVNLSNRGLAIDGLASAGPEEPLALAPARDRIGSCLRAATAAMEAAAQADPDAVGLIVDGLVGELSRVAALAEQAVGIARGAIGRADLGSALAELSAIDDAVLGSEAKAVVGFIVDTAATSAKAVHGYGVGSLERTAELYGAIAESAHWHAERLRAAITEK
ncbi:MAG TPA: DUF115 domain-containing protein [Spirochaetales bacterium]|nr:DUF115 domain-containing protein [Spirochaetales bacterium]